MLKLAYLHKCLLFYLLKYLLKLAYLLIYISIYVLTYLLTYLLPYLFIYADPFLHRGSSHSFQAQLFKEN